MNYLFLIIGSLFAWTLTMPLWKKLGFVRLDYRIIIVNMLYFFLYFGAFHLRGVEKWIGILIVAAPPFVSLFLIYIKTSNLNPLAYFVLLAYFLSLLPIILLSFIKSIIIKVAISLFYFGLIFFITYKGFPIIMHKLKFGTLTGRTKENVPNLDFLTSDNKIVTWSDLKGKLTVLYFWRRGCDDSGFKKLSIFEDLYQKYSSKPDIQFFAVYVFSRDHRGATIDEYSVPKLLLKNEESVEVLFGRTVTSTTIVVNSDLEIIYKGMLESVEKVALSCRKY